MTPTLLGPQIIEFLMKIQSITEGSIHGATVVPSVGVEEGGNIDLWFQFINRYNEQHVGGFGIYIRPAGCILTGDKCGGLEKRPKAQ